MKTLPLLLPPLLLALSSPAQELTTGIVNAGGSLTSGDAVEITGSLGAFGDVTNGDGDTTARGGFPGQIYDPERVAITPGAATLDENSSVRFAAEVVCDDGTLLPAAADLTWSVDSPLLEVSADGTVTAGVLAEGFSAILTAGAAGVTGTAELSAVDVDPDNFGLYAGDGIPDGWQVNWFGTENPGAAPESDPDNDGQDNRTEYLAGTDPTDAASFLHLAFTSGDSPPGTRAVVFTPFLPGRKYALEASESLDADWSALPGEASASEVPGEGVFSDTAVEEGRKFYRLRITVP